jgi:hypothetical protein
MLPPSRLGLSPNTSLALCGCKVALIYWLAVEGGVRLDHHVFNIEHGG